MKLKTRENKRAHQKLATWKLLNMESASIITRALITNRKSPKVKSVAGKVKITSRGFINTLRRPSTIATPMALVNPSNRTASPKIQAVKNTLRVLTNSLNRILLIAKT